MKNIKLWVAGTAVIGPALSYSSIYLFHFVAFFWIAYVFINAIQGRKIVIKNSVLLYPLLLFVAYAVFSLFWHPDFLTWARYQFYFLCGVLVILAVYQYSSSQLELDKLAKVIGIIFLINIFFGFLESLELMRLPSSKYSPYKSLLGYGDDEGGANFENEYLLNKPSGFNFNYNTFGFIVLMFSPFLIFSKNKTIRYGGFILVIWLLISMGSKALFASFMLLFVGLSLYMKLSYKYLISVFVLMPIATLLFALPFFMDDITPEVNRMYSVFEQSALLLSLISSGDIVANNSTTTRAFIYFTGITELINSYGLGLGFGGIESIVGASFHFFFLQLLVDFGVVAFSVFIYFYFKLIVKLRRISFSAINPNLTYYARAASLSLLVVIPASVAPSGVHYQLSFYVLIGFALAIIKVYNLEKFNENSITRRR